MTLVIKKPSAGKLVLAKTYVGTDDPDAATYIAAVEAADGQALETATRVAIHSFVKGCKADGIWPAIKASCILAGARTLAGALVPLVGVAPTNNNFVAGDYNRKTGLVGNRSNKWLASGYLSNSFQQNNFHYAVYLSSAGTSGTNRGHIGTAYVGVNADLNDITSLSSNALIIRNRNDNTGTNVFGSPNGNLTGLIGSSRSQSSNFSSRLGGATASHNFTSFTPSSSSFEIFRAQISPTLYSDARIAFYSLGNSLNLALLDARVTTLINDFGAAIP